MSALLALCSSVLWGTGDFLGGTLSRRVHPLRVIRLSQAMALVGLLVIAVATGDLDAPLGYLGWGVAAGLAGLVGLGCFYAALAAGTMGVVAPVASTGVLVPVLVGLARGESPSVGQFLGIAVTVAGVVLASGPQRSTHPATRPASDARPGSEALPRPAAPSRRASRRPLLLAAVTALAFGSALVLVADGSATSTVMLLATMRATNAGIASVVLCTAARGSVGPGRRDLPVVALIATTDAGANGLYAAATHSGLVSLSAVLASLYPAVTVVLAWRLHGERLARVQMAGVGLLLIGVLLIAAG